MKQLTVNTYKTPVFAKFLFWFLLTVNCLLLTGCGFSPVYGTAGSKDGYGVEEYLEQVGIDVIPDREGQVLRNALIDRFYRYERPVNAPYTLKINKIDESLRDLDITKTDDTTRSQLKLDTKIQLVEKQTGAVVLERSLIAITSYNVLASEFATRVSEDNARKNAITDLARQIELQLSLYFKRGT